MKQGSYLELKTLFDPLSTEWTQTSYEEKRKLLLENFAENDKPRKNIALRIFASKPVASDSVDNKEQFRPSYDSLLLAVGLYLNKGYDKEFEFPNDIAKVKSIVSSLEQLKDGRRKATKDLQDILFTKLHGNTRELFDFGGSEGESSTIPTKIMKLKKLKELGASPIEVHFLHVHNYKSMENYEHVVHEAPYSAFALCWDGDKLL